MDSKVKEEIEIGVNISKLLLQYQQGEFDFDTFIEKSIVEARKSYYADVDGFIDFINSQRDINLPNSSSGSTLTAVLDLDGLFSLIEDDEGIDDLDELYDEMRAYQQSLLRQIDVI
jgi:hypothetical protein